MKKQMFEHYCDLCGVSLMDTQKRFLKDSGDAVRGVNVLDVFSLIKVKYIFKCNLGEAYQELCKECANAIDKVIAKRKALNGGSTGG